MVTTFDGERPEIEEFSTYLTTYPSCTQEIEHLEEEEMHGLRKKGDYQDFIKRWFEEVTRSQYHSFLQLKLRPYSYEENPSRY